MRPREDSSTPDIVFDIGEQDLTRCEFSASSSYFKGIVETAFAVSIDDAKAMDISVDIVKEQLVPSMCQARVVHPTKSLLDFTRHRPKTVVFEFAMAKGRGHGRFESELRKRFADAGLAHTFHWSKNSGLNAAQFGRALSHDLVPVVRGRQFADWVRLHTWRGRESKTTASFTFRRYERTPRNSANDHQAGVAQHSSRKTTSSSWPQKKSGVDVLHATGRSSSL